MSGAILNAGLNNYGSGFSPNTILVVGQGSNNTARMVILTVDGDGVPTSYYLPPESFLTTGALRGCGYFLQDGVPTYFNLGLTLPSPLTIDIRAVGPGSDATHGGIFSLSITAPGSGYALNDTGVIVQGANISSTYKVVGVSGGGVIHLSIEPADGYALGAASLANDGIQPGVGSGCSIDINDVEPCPFGALSGYINRTFGGPSNQ